MTDESGGGYEIAYPEVMNGASKWVYSDEPNPGTITVTREGLRSLLRLVGDCWPVVMGSLLSLHGKTPGEISRVYAKDLAHKSLADLSNRLSKVWCEDALIVSRLFVDDAGNPIINECAESDE